MSLEEFGVKYPEATPKYLKSHSLVDILFKASYHHVASPKDHGVENQYASSTRDAEQEENSNEEVG
jgi:hypothetical protein